MPRLGVLGWPVAHSRSPAMMNAALAELGMRDWRYQLLPVPPEHFAETVRALPEAGFVGANVTIPHKRAALALADSASEAARAIGAANTLTFAATDDAGEALAGKSVGGALAAENTDAPGFIAALGTLEGLPAHPRAQVLGAGGSARAVVWALREAGASEVSVWNRTSERARALAEELGVRAVGTPEPADLLVNCTPVGLAQEIENIESTGLKREGVNLQQSANAHQALNLLEMTFDQVGNYSYVVDLVYRSTPTPLIAAARAHGAQTVDGLEMLLAQGALSFELWTGRTPPLDVMRRALR